MQLHAEVVVPACGAVRPLRDSLRGAAASQWLPPKKGGRDFTALPSERENRGGRCEDHLNFLLCQATAGIMAFRCVSSPRTFVRKADFATGLHSVPAGSGGPVRMLPYL